MDEPIGNYFIENDSVRPAASLGAALRALHGSVYEVVKMVGKTPLFLEDHVDRLVRSASLAGYPLPDTCIPVREQIGRLTDACGISSTNVRIAYGHTGPAPKPTLIIHFVQSRYPDEEMYRAGVRTGLLRGERNSPAVKLSETPVRKRADALLADGTLFEVLLVNGDGFITEGSRTNVFFITGDTLITPPARDVLPGITRQKVFEIVHQSGIDLIEKPVHRSSVRGFDALFLTGTSADVLPVRSVEDVSFGVNHPLMRRVMESFGRYVDSYLNNTGNENKNESG